MSGSPRLDPLGPQALWENPKQLTGSLNQTEGPGDRSQVLTASSIETQGPPPVDGSYIPPGPHWDSHQIPDHLS